MSKHSNHKRTFKLKRYPSKEIDGITHVYPPSEAKVSQIVERDRLYFLANPDIRAYIRHYVPGELDGIKLSGGMLLSEIAYVLVQRLPSGLQQARIPLTKEQGEKWIEKRSQL